LGYAIVYTQVRSSDNKIIKIAFFTFFAVIAEMTSIWIIGKLGFWAAQKRWFSFQHIYLWVDLGLCVISIIVCLYIYKKVLHNHASRSLILLVVIYSLTLAWLSVNLFSILAFADLTGEYF
jgi:hypothetical protein